MVFIHLYKRLPRVHYYLTRTKRQEVDFIAVGSKEHPALVVQVCMDISHEETRKKGSWMQFLQPRNILKSRKI